MSSKGRYLAAAIILATLVSALGNLRFDNSLKRWIPPDAGEVAEYQSFLRTFGDDALLILVFEDAGKFVNKSRLAKITMIADTIAGLPHVVDVARWPLPYFRLKRRVPDHLMAYIIRFTPESPLNPYRAHLLNTINRLRENYDGNSYLAGTGVFHQAINSESKRYTIRYLGLGLLVLLTLLFAIVKRRRAIPAVLLVALGGIGVMLAVSSVFNIPLNLLSIILPVLILFYATANSLHILSHNGNFRRCLKPCFLACLTTSLGFGVFIFESIPLLQDFAKLAISGILGSFCWMLLLFFPEADLVKPGSAPKLSLLTRLQKLERRAIWTASALLLILLLPGIFLLRSEIYTLSVISKHHPTVHQHHFIEENVSFYIPLEYQISVDGDSLAIYDWFDEVVELNEVAGGISYLSFRRESIAASAGYYDSSSGLGRITFLVPLLSTTAGTALVEKIDRLAGRLAGSPPKITGYVTLYARIAEEIRRSFLRSLAAAFLLVFAVIFLFVRSPRIFLAAILPNLLPLITILGLMGWMNIPLDMISMPMGCLLLSIIVDDSIHFLYWYRSSGSVEEAFAAAANPMLQTTLILAGGFAIFILAPTPPLQYFGILSVTGLLTALFADLLLLPTVLPAYPDKATHQPVFTK